MPVTYSLGPWCACGPAALGLSLDVLPRPRLHVTKDLRMGASKLSIRASLEVPPTTVLGAPSLWRLAASPFSFVP